MNTPAFPSGAIQKRRINQDDPGSDFAIIAKTSPMHDGMTLRDYFAAKAMAAIIMQDGRWCMDDETAHELIAGYSYEMADAMMKEKNK